VYSTDSTAKQREAEDKKLDKSFTKLLHQAKANTFSFIKQQWATSVAFPLILN
jgi:hypothetical protein